MKTKSRLSLAVVFLLMNIVCLKNFEDSNPHDPDFRGDYRFSLKEGQIPDTAYLLLEYRLEYSTGKDTFKLKYPDKKLSRFIDTSRFYDQENKVLCLVPVKSDSLKIPLLIIAETPNLNFHHL